MFTPNCLKDTCDLKYAALGNSELVHKVTKVDTIKLCFLFGINSMQGSTDTATYGVIRKRSTKRLQHTGNLFRKNLKESVNSRLKSCLDHRSKETFYRQRIPEPRCARKKTVDIEILLISRNGDRKIMQSIGITSRPILRISKWNQLNQFR